MDELHVRFGATRHIFDIIVFFIELKGNSHTFWKFSVFYFIFAT